LCPLISPFIAYCSVVINGKHIALIWWCEFMQYASHHCLSHSQRYVLHLLNRN
jgi:hypothetical protein